MSQNIIRFFNDFAATFPSDKSAEKTAFEQNIAQVFADDLATAVQRSGAKNISPQVGNLVFWRTAAQEIQCGIVLNDKTSVLRLDGNSTEKIPLPKEVIGVADARGLLSKDATTEYNDMVRSIRNYEEKVGMLNKITTETGLELEAEMYFTAHLSPAIAMIVRSFEQNLMAISPAAPNVLQQIKALVENKGRELWDKAVQLAQANNFENPDDRPLYWARLRMAVALKKHNFFAPNVDYRLSDGLIIPGSALQSIAIRFEEVTRNYTHVSFPSNLKKILITGFDPFHLTTNIKQSNPSGPVVLALHNKIIQDENGCDYAQIQVMMMPVRYADFDGSQAVSGNIQGEGVVEKYIRPYIYDDTLRADMIVTISQSLPDNYNIDKYATSRRGGSDENMGVKRTEGSKSVNGANWLEYIHTSLPKAMIPLLADPADPNPNAQGHEVKLESSARYDPINPQVMLKGSGGNYLSNEIFYRVAKMREEWIIDESPNADPPVFPRKFPSGHFHIAKIQGAGEDFKLLESKKIVLTVLDRLKRGVHNLNDLLAS
jgi:hypothetical protein